jgi:glycosyltransferase involved in cell wall biosynthesis
LNKIEKNNAAAGNAPDGGVLRSGTTLLSPPPSLRICHVITRMIIGGAQENTLLSVRGLMDKGHEVTLLTGPTTGPEGCLLDTEDTDGMTIVEESSLIRPVSPIQDIRAYQRLHDFFRQQNFDVVHTHSSKAGILGRMAAWKARVPFVVHTVHGQAFHPYQSWLTNRFYIFAERFAAKRCHHICAVAQAMVDQCVTAKVAPPQKYSVVYSGMDLSPYLDAPPDCELRKKLGIPENSLVIGKVARLFELKGHDYLLQAAPAIVAHHPDVRFLLVGDGNLRESLEHQVAELGLADNFVFAGLVPPSDIPRYMSIMDCLVHLSLREGLPRTVVQAFASGIPAVAFALDGTPEVVQHGTTGYLCSPGDVESVTQHLNQLLTNPVQRQSMGAKGRDLVVQRFDWRHMADMLEALYLQDGTVLGK